MNRFIIVILALLCVIQSAVASTPAEDLLSRVISNIKSYNPYEVKVDIDYRVGSISGSYQVDGDKYYISVDGQELYGDSTTKYEIYNDRQEVVIDQVSAVNSGNILDNPATAFDAILDTFIPSILSSTEGVTTIYLKPTAGEKAMVDCILLKVDATTNSPKEIEYIFNDESVTITILSIERLKSSITLYDSSKYADYEIIDFR